MEISFKQTPIHRLLAIRSFQKNHPHEKIQNTIGLIIGPVFTFIILILLNSMATESANFSGRNNLGLTIMFMIPPSIIFGGGGYLAYRSYKQKFQNIYPDDLPEKYFGETTISIDSNGLHIIAPLSSHSYDWSMISFIETGDYLLFHFLRNLLAFIPTASVDSKNDIEKFTNEVNIFIMTADNLLSSNEHSAYR